MEITVTRLPSIQGATLGRLQCTDFSCWTLEDNVREPETRDGVPFSSIPAWVASWKVPNETAIPRGRYRVLVTHSVHFGKDLPLLLDVPGFDGVRIHSGNSAADTEGCILVGLGKEANLIYQSRAAFDQLFPKIKAAIAAGEHVYITLQ